MKSEYLTLKEAAEYLNISVSSAHKEWPRWAEFGCVPSRFPRHTLRFKRSDLDRLMEATKVSI